MSLGSSCMSINPFPQHRDEPLEKRSQNIEHVVQVDDPLIQKVIRVYERLIMQQERDAITSLDALSPEQIDSLLQHVLSHYDCRGKNSYPTGDFFSRLIKESASKLKQYKFILTTGDHRIESLPNFLPSGLSIEFIGNTGMYAGQKCDGCRFDIRGDANIMLGIECSNSRFIIYGNVDSSCCLNAEYSEITIYGNAADMLGAFSQNSLFTLYGEIGNYPLDHASGCELKVANESAYEKARTQVPAGNEVILFDPNVRIRKGAGRR